MLHGTIAPLAGAARTLSQLAEDGLLPEFMAKRSRTDAPWVATLITAGMAIVFLLIGDPVWLIAAANPDLSHRHRDAERRRLAAPPQRAGIETAVPRAARTIALGLFAAGFHQLAESTALAIAPES